MSAEVKIAERSVPFLAEDCEVLPSGWLRVVGHWRRWVEDDASGEVVVRLGQRREYQWPPNQIREVRRV